MASIYKRNESNVLWMRFAYKGKTYRETTGQSNKQKAEAVMRKRIKEIQGSGSANDLFKRLLVAIDKLPVNEQDELRREFASKLRSSTVVNLSLADAFAEYSTKPRKHDPSPATLKRYQGDWKRFTDWLATNHATIEYMHQVEHVHAMRYMTARWKEGITSRTFNKDLTLYKGIFKTLWLEAGLQSNPFDHIEKQGLKTTGKKNLEPGQIEALLAVASGEMKTMLLLGLYTGLRLGDCATIRNGEIDLEAGTITRTTNKTGDEVKVPIHEVLRAVLQPLMNAEEHLLPTTADLYNRSPSNVSVAVQKVFKKAEIDTHAERKDGRGKKATTVLGFHSLRHSFVSMCHAANVPSIAIMDMVGHHSEVVHKIYQHSNTEQKRKAIASLPNITGGAK